MKKFKRIWLQNNGPNEDRTWCSDKINDDDVEYVLASTARAEGVAQWVPVDERKPPPGHTVLLATKASRYPMRGCWLSYGAWQNEEDVASFFQEDVTHWSEYPPMPSPSMNSSRSEGK